MQHSELVRALMKPGADISLNLTPAMADLWHAATGISGEAGELLDAVKKAAIYNKPLDVDNVIEELGDLRFYMEALRQRVSKIVGREITDEEILERNVAKLQKRYGEKYSDSAAQARADKQE